MSYPFSVYWKMRYIEIIIYFIVLTTLFTLSFFPSIYGNKAYRITLQVIMGILIGMSAKTLILSTRRMNQGYDVVVMQSNTLLWPSPNYIPSMNYNSF